MYRIRIPSTGQMQSIETDLVLELGQEILIENEGITEIAVLLCDNKCPKLEEISKSIFVRALTPEDKTFKNGLKKKAEEYLNEAKAKAFRHGLEMKILDANLSFDEKKLTFYFSADGRIDFRALVADMVGSFRKMIRLQQVGPREEAKYFGGYGKCGRELCCAKFLNNLENVTLEMANLQDANTKSNKAIGCCGKLMCCLSFEAENYEKLKAQMPKIGTNFKSKQGEGKVIGHNIFEGKITLETSQGKRIEVDK